MRIARIFLFALAGLAFSQAAFSQGPAPPADSSTPIVVSSASSAVGVTADSLATIYGDHLSTQIASAESLPWPTTLGDISGVTITDAAQHKQQVPLIYVSPTQMNVWIPPGTAVGPATLSFPFTGLPPGAGTAALQQVPVTIQQTAPALFSIDGSGTGIAAASALRMVIPTNIQSPVPVFQCGPSGCAAVPIQVGLDAPVYLSLYGSGIRGASSPSNVMVTIGGTKVQPLYAGAQKQLPGVDQVNVVVPISLRGSGVVEVTVTVDGVTSNAVLISIE